MSNHGLAAEMRTAALVMLAAALAGCSKDIGYSHTITYPNGAVEVESFAFKNRGYDTKLGKLDVAKTPAGGIRVGIENLDSQSRALDLASKAVDAAAAIAGRAAKP